MNQLKLTTIFTNPRNINMSDSFLYYIQIRDIVCGNEYRYVGQARNMERIKEYDDNMGLIYKGQPKSIYEGQSKRYRAVHFVLYKALREGWEVNAHPLISCAGMDKCQANAKEKAFIKQLQCNLNDKHTPNKLSSWCIEHLTDTTIESLGVNPIGININ